MGEERSVVSFGVRTETQISACRTNAATVGESQFVVERIIVHLVACDYVELESTRLLIRVEREEDRKTVEDCRIMPEQPRATTR
jgi:hypothetical protein